MMMSIPRLMKNPVAGSSMGLLSCVLLLSVLLLRTRSTAAASSAFHHQPLLMTTTTEDEEEAGTPNESVFEQHRDLSGDDEHECHCDGAQIHCDHSHDEEGKECHNDGDDGWVVHDTVGAGDCHCDGDLIHCDVSEDEAGNECHNGFIHNTVAAEGCNCDKEDLSCADSHDEAGMICVKDEKDVYKAVLDPQWNNDECHCDGYVAHCEHPSEEEEYAKQYTSNDTTNNHGGGIGDCHCDGLIPHCKNEAYEEAHADHCAQNLGKEGTRIGGGIRMMTDVYIQLHRDQKFKVLTDIMGDESCTQLAEGKKVYNDESYYADIPHYTGSKGIEMKLYDDYYGSGFLQKWTKGAFENGKVDFENFPQDFSKLPGDTDGSGDCVGREEAVKKGIAYTSTYIDMNQYFEDAIDKIQQEGCIWGKELYTNGEPNSSPCKKAVNAWERAIATWSGSIEGEYGRNLREPGKTGKFLQALAEKRCLNFKTCGTSSDDATNDGVAPRSNMNIIAAFKKGHSAVFYGQVGLVRSVVSEINKELTVSRVQGVLRYAYRMGKNKSTKDKEIAEGAAFAFGLLPQIYACNKKSAAILASNTNIGGERTSRRNGQSVSFGNVRAALECNYKCLGIRFSDVGSLNDCVDKNGNKALCFQKRSDSGNICGIKNSNKFKAKCAKTAPKENKNKVFAKTRHGSIAKKRF